MWAKRSAWASAQSDQSLRCPHEESLDPTCNSYRPAGVSILCKRARETIRFKISQTVSLWMKITKHLDLMHTHVIVLHPNALSNSWFKLYIWYLWFVHRRLVNRGWFEIFFESLGNSSDSSRKQIFGNILRKFSYHENVRCVYSLESPHRCDVILTSAYTPLPPHQGCE